MKLYIKHMVSRRCKMLVIEELKKLGLTHTTIELGVVEVAGVVTTREFRTLNKAFINAGLELIKDKKAILIERIKTTIIHIVRNNEEPLKVNFSVYLSEHLHYNYTYLANLFSCSEGITIEHFMIKHKIEKVKELLMDEEYTLTEIAFQLNYSSVSHLSRQFKKVTGITPSFFKTMINKKRKVLEAL